MISDRNSDEEENKTVGAYREGRAMAVASPEAAGIREGAADFRVVDSRVVGSLAVAAAVVSRADLEAEVGQEDLADRCENLWHSP